jgi:hypothetical protein
MCIGASAAAITLGTFAVNPQNTFLFESPTDVNAGALFISLNCPQGVTTNCVNAPAGTILQLIGVGIFCYAQAGCPPEDAASLAGVFDSNNVLLNSSSLPAGNVNRLTGIIAAGASNNLVNHNPFLNTFYGNVDTTIPNDFFIPTVNGITIVVPTGANFLVVGVLDSFYADNADPSHTLALQVNQIGAPPGVPEPATLGLLGLGMLGLAAVLRRRSA